MYIQTTEKIILGDDAEFLQEFMDKLEVIINDLEDDGLICVTDDLRNAIRDFLEHPSVRSEE